MKDTAIAHDRQSVPLTSPELPATATAATPTGSARVVAMQQIVLENYFVVLSGMGSFGTAKCGLLIGETPGSSCLPGVPMLTRNAI